MGAQRLHTERVQAGGRAPHGRSVAAQLLGPVDVAAGRHPHPLPLPRPGVVGRRGGRGGGRRGGGGGGAGGRAAGGEGVRPPRPARASLAAVRAMTRARLVPAVAGVVTEVMAVLLLPRGVSEVHLFHTPGGPEAVVMGPQRAEVIPGHSLLSVARRSVRLWELEERLLGSSAVGVLLHFS